MKEVIPLSPTIEYCTATLFLSKDRVEYRDSNGKVTVIPEHLRAIAVLRAKRLGGILIRDAMQTNS